MDPDPSHFFKIYWIVFTKNNFQIFVLFFSLIFILILDEPFRNEEIFIISLFLRSSDLGCRCKKVFFCSFWLIFYPLDPDPGSQNLADLDPKHWMVPLFIGHYHLYMEGPLQLRFKSLKKNQVSSSDMTYRIVLFLKLKFVEFYLDESRFLFEINSASSCSSDLNIFGDLRRDQLIWILISLH